MDLYGVYIEFLKKNWKVYILYLITLIYIPLQNITLPHYYGKIINSLKNFNISTIKYYFLILIIIWIIIQGCAIGVSLIDNYIWPKLHSYIRDVFFNFIVDKYNKNYQDLKIGSIITKIIKLPWILDDVSNQMEDFCFKNSILIISNFIYLFSSHYSLGFMYLGSISAVFIMSIIYYKSCNENIKKAENLYDDCHEEIEDSLQNLLSIYTNNKITNEKDRIKQINEHTQQTQYISGVCTRKYNIYFAILNIILFIALNYLSFRLYQQGKIKLSSLISIFIINYAILTSLLQLFENTKHFMSAKAQVEIVQEFIDSIPKDLNDDNEIHYKKIVNPEKLDIEFKNIDYTPTDETNKLYDNFNLRIYPMQKIAIVGESGSGKTTFSNLLCKLKTFQKGDILINGISINEIELSDLRDKIVYIPQHPKLFNRTLAENLTYGLPADISIEQIFKFMRDNGFVDLEKIFRERLNDNVGKNGSKYSGGQKSAIWFIRAAMKPSSILIADEPSSSLDPQSKQYIKRMIDILGRNRTIILITHDIDMTGGMDRIITFSKGKIISDKTKKY